MHKSSVPDREPFHEESESSEGVNGWPRQMVCELSFGSGRGDQFNPGQRSPGADEAARH
jgi:hypothetical protein